MRKESPSTSLHPAEQYAYDVIHGNIVACRFVKLAAQRYFDDRRDEKEKGFFFDQVAAQRILDFFPKFLRFYEGQFEGKPFVLQPWQQFILWNIFGFKNDDGNRRFRTAYLEISKGSGKTPMAAGVGLYGLTLDHEAGAEIYVAATMLEQAGIMFRDAKAFAENSPYLSRHLIIGQHNIAFPKTNSFLRPISSEHRGLDGKRPHMALIDEIHEHPTSIVVDKMRAGTKGRSNALIMMTTNSGVDRTSICYQYHEMVEKILTRVVDNESTFGYIVGLDVCEDCAAKGATSPTEGCSQCDDWQDESVWVKSNVNLGVSITKQYLREQVDEAIVMPAKQNIVKRLNFSMWTQATTRWLSLDQWMACNAPLTLPDLAGKTCYGGLDLSTTTDLSALVWVFPPDSEEDTYRVICRFFVPEDNMRDRVKRDRVPYDVWVRDGFITTTPGNTIDYGYILKRIEEDCEMFDVRELAFDRWGSQKITTDLQDLGFNPRSDSGASYGDRILVQFGQGYASMNSPCKELEKIIAGRQLVHGNNPVLSWMASNVVVQGDAAGNIKPAKDKSTERIDGIVALLMGLDRAVRNKYERSVYEDEGVLMI